MYPPDIQIHNFHVFVKGGVNKPLDYQTSKSEIRDFEKPAPSKSDFQTLS